MDILSESEMDNIAAASKLVAKYNKVIDSESAHEILTEKLNAAAELSAEQPAAKTRRVKEEKSMVEEVFDSPVMKQVGRTAASVITRSLLGALGLGGRSRRKSLF